MITPHELLSYAKRIASDPSISEAELRSAISRAYYALYHYTLETMVRKYSLDLINRIEKSKRKRLRWRERTQLNSLDSDFLRRCNFHKILPDTLIDINRNTLAISFKNIRDRRNQADYDLQKTLTYTDADTIVNSVDILVGVIRSI